jgi:hypothetical protein
MAIRITSSVQTNMKAVSPLVGAPESEEGAERGRQFALLILEVGHLLDERAVARGQVRARIDGGLETPFGIHPPCDDDGVFEPAQSAPERLERVRQAEPRVAEVERFGLHGIGLDERSQRLHAGAVELGGVAIADITTKLELGYGLQTTRGAGVSHDEDRVAFAKPVLVHGKVRVVGERLPVVSVDPEEGEVQRVARESEVVRIATEVAHLQFGCGHEFRIRVAPEHVGRSATPVVERHHLYGKSRALTPALPENPGFDRGQQGLSTLPPLGRRKRVERGVHLVRDVHDLDELIGLEFLDPALVGQVSGNEPIIEE